MNKLVLSFVLVMMGVSVYAQKPKVIKGDWKSLAGIEKFDLIFNYDEVTIPDFETEEDYIKQKMSEKEEDKAGSGKEWREKYFADRDMHYEEKFVESFNKRGSWKALEDYDEAEYQLTVFTTELYHGWNVGVMRKPARIAARIEVSKKGEDNPILVVEYEDVKGADAMGYDFAIHSRVAEGYAKLAKSFLRDVKKKAK